MKEKNSQSDIPGLIVKYLLDSISEDEKQILNNWISEKNSNKQLFYKIMQSENYRLWAELAENIDLKTDWENVLSTIEIKKRKKLRLNILKYAAVFLLPVIVASGIYFYTMHDEPVELLAQVDSIQPGKTKAVLVLGNGKSVDLDTSEDISILELDGTQIEKSEGSLNYTKSGASTIVAPIYNTIIIPRGGEYSLVLSDGSRIFLNSMSEFRYPVQFSGNKREVELTGEAYFEVAKNVSMPFHVKTKGIEIEVLGTSFNVNAYEDNDNIVTTLVEGRVRLNSNETTETFELTPSEQAIYSLANGETKISKVNVSQFTGWKDGKLIFYDSKLEDVMKSLSRWYSFDITYTNAEIREIRTNCNLDKRENIYEFLDIIRTTGKIEINVEKNNITLSKK